MFLVFVLCVAGSFCMSEERKRTQVVSRTLKRQCSSLRVPERERERALREVVLARRPHACNTTLKKVV
jgi:hypothetical protein